MEGERNGDGWDPTRFYIQVLTKRRESLDLCRALCPGLDASASGQIRSVNMDDISADKMAMFEARMVGGSSPALDPPPTPRSLSALASVTSQVHPSSKRGRQAVPRDSMERSAG